MTHPLTPREKVEKAVERAVLRACNRTSGVKDVRLSSLICGEEIDQATDAILTALASGSGDHAELIERVREVAGDCLDAKDGGIILGGTVAREHGADLEALLAEIAALRGGVQSLEIRRDFYKHNMQRAEARATEAERKLAEANQVIRDIAETPYTGADWPRSRAATYLAGKEAERG
nr:hypothetical protein [Brevundimonas diminuta]